MASDQVLINIHDHGIVIDRKRGRVKCNYCGKEVSGITRLKCHLGDVGTDVVRCEKVPDDVKESFRTLLGEKIREAPGKNVQKICHQNGGRKKICRGFSNGVERIKHDDGQSSGSESRKYGVVDSGIDDDVIEHLPVSNRMLHASRNRRIDVKLDRNLEARGAVSSIHVAKHIGKFFCETGIDFNYVNSVSFKTMLNSTVGDSRIETPTIHELNGWILSDEVKDVQEYVKKIKASWESTGCSILLDGWINEKGQHMVSFVVECPEGPIYLRSADVSDIRRDEDATLLLLDRVIAEVGADNVVQIVACSTTDWVGNIGKRFSERRSMFFWSVSASHCIKLMLEKIGEMDWVKKVIDEAKIITKFIDRNEEVSKLVRYHTKISNLGVPCKIKFAVPFLTLNNIVSKGNNLKNMFVCSEWTDSFWASSQDGKKVTDLIGDLAFWNAAEMTVKATVPLVNVLCLITEDDKPLVGYIYETMDQVKETIKEEFNHEESQYDPFWQVIDDIWNTHLHSPLHATGYNLNPNLFYSTDFYSDSEVLLGFLRCHFCMVRDHRKQDLICTQLEEYMRARGAFKEGSAITKRAKISPVQWWSTYGKECPELQKFAIRILSQTCDGAMRYGLKRGLAEKLLLVCRSHIEQQQLENLTYVHYNLHLRNMQVGHETLFGAEESDSVIDWFGDDTLENAPKWGGLEWM